MISKHTAQPLPALTEEEIRLALCTNNVELIQDLFKLVLALQNGETDRGKSLDGKAASLFGLVGILISVGFIALSSLAGKADQPFSFLVSGCLGAPLVVFTLVLLLASCACLYASVRVKAVQGAPGDRDLFSSIKEFDGHNEKSADKAFEQDGHLYRRFLCEHYWKLYSNLFSQNETKGTILAWGQGLLFTALFMLVAAQIYAVVTSPGRLMDKEIPPKTTQTATPPALVPSAKDVASQKVTEATSNSRPAELRASSNGKAIHNEGDKRPETLQASSAGRPVKLSEVPPKKIIPKGEK